MAALTSGWEAERKEGCYYFLLLFIKNEFLGASFFYSDNFIPSEFWGVLLNIGVEGVLPPKIGGGLFVYESGFGVLF